MAKNVHDLVIAELGADFVERETNTTIGVTVGVLVRNDPRRMGFTIINLSTGVLYVKPKEGASSTNGIRLGPSGGNLTVYWKLDGMLPTRDWTIIGSAADLAYYIIEYIMADVD